MNRNVIVKLVCLVGYLLFAGFSAYFTATSLWLNLLNGSDMWTMWLVFVLVLVVSILAGMCLTNAIRELTNCIRPSRSAFILNLLGFLIFWAFSFTTNVHYFFVEKHGFSILSKELISAKNYIIDNTSKTNQGIEDEKEKTKQDVDRGVKIALDAFNRELRNSMDGQYGFGQKCVNHLREVERALKIGSETYGDTATYVVYDENTDKGYYGTKDRNLLSEYSTIIDHRVSRHLDTKHDVINKYYNRKKIQKEELTDLLGPIAELENKELPELEKDGTVKAYYKYNSLQDARVISKMPNDYNNKCVEKKGDKIVKFNTYPSKRMFDTMSVWKDITAGRLSDMTMLQWIIISLIFDIVSFILFSLFRKSND